MLQYVLLLHCYHRKKIPWSSKLCLRWCKRFRWRRGRWFESSRPPDWCPRLRGRTRGPRWPKLPPSPGESSRPDRKNRHKTTFQKRQSTQNDETFANQVSGKRRSLLKFRSKLDECRFKTGWERKRKKSCSVQIEEEKKTKKVCWLLTEDSSLNGSFMSWLKLHWTRPTLIWIAKPRLSSALDLFNLLHLNLNNSMVPLLYYLLAFNRHSLSSM